MDEMIDDASMQATEAPLQDEMTLELTRPLVLGQTSYDKLELREPTAGELAQSARGAQTEMDAAIALISLVSKVPRRAVEQILQRDLEVASDFLGSFIGRRKKKSGALSSN